MLIISVVNRKGGSGKTTTAVNLACQFSIDYPDKKILLIDLDTQNHARKGLGKTTKTTALGIHKIFNNSQHTFSGMVQATQWKNLFFIPADEEAMENNMGSGFYRLKHFLNSNNIKLKYDIAIIDTPPNHGSFLINSLKASNAIIISFVPQLLDQSGVDQIFKLIKRHTDNHIKIALLPNMLKPRIRHHNNTLAALVKAYGTAFLLKGIRSGIQLAEAFEANLPIQYYAPKSRGAFDYHMLLNELKLIWPDIFQSLEPESIKKQIQFEHQLYSPNQIRQKEKITHKNSNNIIPFNLKKIS